MSEPAPKCPTCGREVHGNRDLHPFPFCSPRCKLAELGNWLDARYVVRDGLALDEADPPGGSSRADEP